MEFFTRRNIAVLGLTQVGCLVFAVLGAGAAVKVRGEVSLTAPTFTRLLCDYGPLGLALPLVWIVAAVVVLHRPDDEGAARLGVALSGLLLLALILFAAWRGAAVPLLSWQGCALG